MIRFACTVVCGCGAEAPAVLEQRFVHDGHAQGYATVASPQTLTVPEGWYLLRNRRGARCPACRERVKAAAAARDAEREAQCLPGWIWNKRDGEWQRGDLSVLEPSGSDRCFYWSVPRVRSGYADTAHDAMRAADVANAAPREPAPCGRFRRPDENPPDENPE